jgi:hypothetical protein
MFWINFADIEMKLDLIVYDNKLHIKFEIPRFWSIFDRVTALTLFFHPDPNFFLLENLHFPHSFIWSPTYHYSTFFVI